MLGLGVCLRVCSSLDAILENDHELAVAASQRSRLWLTTMFRIWAYGRDVGGAWSTTISVLGVKKQHSDDVLQRQRCHPVERVARAGALYRQATAAVTTP